MTTPVVDPLVIETMTNLSVCLRDTLTAFKRPPFVSCLRWSADYPSADFCDCGSTIPDPNDPEGPALVTNGQAWVQYVRSEPNPNITNLASQCYATQWQYIFRYGVWRCFTGEADCEEITNDTLGMLADESALRAVLGCSGLAGRPIRGLGIGPLGPDGACAGVYMELVMEGWNDD